MELRQLEHFIAIAEESSFTRAAARANIVQSGLSMSIRSLERELGVELFHREGRAVRLTPSGEALLPEARRVLAALRSARAAIQESSGMLRGPLAIGFPQTYEHPSPLARLLGRFHREHPAVQLRIIQGAGRVGYDALLRGEVDMLVGGVPPARPPGVGMIPILSIPFRVVCSPRSPLAGRSSMSLAEAAKHPFVDLNSDWSARRALDHEMAAAGVERVTTCTVTEVWTLLQLVEQDLGIAIVPEMFRDVPMELDYVDLVPPLPPFELVAAFVGDTPVNPAARAFLSMVTTEMLGEEIVTVA